MNKLFQLLSKVRLVIVMGLLGVGSFHSAEAQTCTASLVKGYPSEGCFPLTTKMEYKVTGLAAGVSVTRWNWNFGNKQSNTNAATDSIVETTYTTASPDTTKDFQPSLVIKTAKGDITCKWVGPIVKVWDHPVAKIKFPAKTTQCFENNSFCFNSASLTSRNKFPIKGYAWDFGDGTTDSGLVPSKGCQNYQFPGKYTITLSITDSKGCTDTKKEVASIVVLEKLVPIFAIVGGAQGCIPDTVTFKNQTDTSLGYHVAKFEWDFGDGSPKETVNWGNNTKKGFALKHVYTKVGTYSPTLTITTKEGCVKRLVQKNGVELFDPKLKLKVPDTVCWSVANAGLNFHADTVKGASTQIWNFNDPPSGNENVKLQVYDVFHAFQAGPKNYAIRFTVVHPICGVLDTCFRLTVMGPQARLNITVPQGAPVPLETFKPSFYLEKGSDLYGRNLFYEAMGTGYGCHKTINYSYFTHNPTKTTKVDSNYCNGKVSIKYINDTICASTTAFSIVKKYDAASYFVKASGFTTRSYSDSTEVTGTWDRDAGISATNTIPGVNPSFSVAKRLKYQDFVNYRSKIISDSLNKIGGFSTAQIRLLIEKSLAKDVRSQKNKFNTISNEKFNTDSFYDAQNDGRNPSVYNSIVGPDFNLDSYLVRLKNPTSTAPTKYNTLGVWPLLYTQSGGISFPQNMHDSDKYDCQYPNLVKFTNNSIKFRGVYTQPDDKWTNPNPDTCLDTNWPYSSDSLTYLWDFADNGTKAEPCTSTVKGIVWPSGTTPKAGVNKWDCSYSTLAAPYHFYQQTAATDVWIPCYFPSMEVKDTITGCKDRTIFQIVMGAPYSGYDTTAFCKMNYEIQYAISGGASARKGPYKGIRMLGIECPGYQNRFNVNLQETIPGTCQPPAEYKISFDVVRADSLNGKTKWFKDRKTGKRTRNPNPDDILCLSNRRIDSKGKILYDTVWNRYWLTERQIGAPVFGVKDNKVTKGLTGTGKFAYPDTTDGFKDVCLITKNGDCWDTFVYKKYFFFQKLTNELVFGKKVDLQGIKNPLTLVTIPDTTNFDNTAPVYAFFDEGNKLQYDTTVLGQYFNLKRSPISPIFSSALPGFDPLRTYASLKYSVGPNRLGKATFLAQNKARDLVNITTYYMNVQRDQLPAGDRYIDQPIWPTGLDTNFYGTLNPDGTYDFTDTINAVADTVYEPRLTGQDTVFALVFNPRSTALALKDKFVKVAFIPGTGFYVNNRELDSLKKGYNPTMSLYTKTLKFDPRVAKLDLFCGNKPGDNTKYDYPIRLYHQVDPSRPKVNVGPPIYLKNLQDTAVTDYSNLKKPHGTFKIVLPAPGVYTFTSYIKNTNGCQNLSPTNTYQVINGHFAKFSTDREPVGCTNDRFQFFDTVRYFHTSEEMTPLMPPLYAAHYPSGIWDVDPLDTNLFFRPWDELVKGGNPANARAKWRPTWNPRVVAKPEKLEWDFNNDGVIDATGHNPTYRYKEPGVYSVDMISTDSNGYVVHTLARNYVKIIKMVDSIYVLNTFNGKINDTVRTCAPQVFTIVDSSYIHKGVNTTFVGRTKFAYTDSILTIDPISGRKRVVTNVNILDSIAKLTWNQGDGRGPFSRNTVDTARNFTYTENDTFTLSHKIYTSRNLAGTASTCLDSTVKKDWLVVLGPKPRFKFTSPAIGCLPFAVTVKNLSLKDQATYNFDKHDGTSVTTNGKSEYFDLIFDHLTPADSAAGKDSSIFFVDVQMTDSVYNPTIKAKVKCVSPVWPNADTTKIPRDTVFQVVVYRRDSVKIAGEKILCPNETSFYKATSRKAGLYVSYNWIWGDGTETKNGTDNEKHAYKKPGSYRISLYAVSKYNKFCGPQYATFDVLVDSVKAWISVDSAKSDFELGKIVFRTKGLNDNDTVKDNAMIGVKYDIETVELDTIKNSESGLETAKDQKAYSSFSKDYSSRLSLDETWDPNGNELKSWKFRVKMTAYSARPCPDDTTIFIKIKRNFETFNIFTPGNNDGKNDKFDPKVEGETSYLIMIFNRWGAKVFESADAKTDWDGTIFNNGTACPAGTYFYIVKYDLIGRKKGIATRTGIINLVR